MNSSSGVRVTDRLQEVNLDHLLYGKSTKTLCSNCLAQEVSKPSFLQTVEVTSNTPHTMCNVCGAITADDYATRYS